MVVGQQHCLQGQFDLDLVEQHLDKDIVKTLYLGRCKFRGVEHELDVGCHGTQLKVGPPLLVDGIRVADVDAASLDVEQKEEGQKYVLVTIAQVSRPPRMKPPIIPIFIVKSSLLSYCYYTIIFLSVKP